MLAGVVSKAPQALLLPRNLRQAPRLRIGLSHTKPHTHHSTTTPLLRKPAPALGQVQQELEQQQEQEQLDKGQTSDAGAAAAAAAGAAAAGAAQGKGKGAAAAEQDKGIPTTAGRDRSQIVVEHMLKERGVPAAKARYWASIFRMVKGALTIIGGFLFFVLRMRGVF